MDSVAKTTLLLFQTLSNCSVVMRRCLIFERGEGDIHIHVVASCGLRDGCEFFLVFAPFNVRVICHQRSPVGHDRRGMGDRAHHTINSLKIGPRRLMVAFNFTSNLKLYQKLPSTCFAFSRFRDKRTTTSHHTIMERPNQDPHKRYPGKEKLSRRIITASAHHAYVFQ